MLEGYHVRISGQDVGRGTFSQRHVMLVDQQNERTVIPLNNLQPTGHQGKLEIANSSLSEFAVMGFEMGVSWEHPDRLCIWEAQFGDFFNGAQIIIDTYLASGESKWLRQSGLVLLLPHGYDGAGPEHSSCRVERFLQLCDSKFEYNDSTPEIPNMHVVNPTTPAQFFHLLRRQMKRNFRKPLVVVGPKVLLRHPSAVSDMAEMAPGTTFQPVLADPASATVERVVFLSGKIYYDLVKERSSRQLEGKVAFVRVEEIAPFPWEDLKEAVGRFKNAKEFIWLQEEHRNQGAYTFVAPRLQQLLPNGAELQYRGRGPMAAPATGIGSRHKLQNMTHLNVVTSKEGQVAIKRSFLSITATCRVTNTLTQRFNALLFGNTLDKYAQPTPMWAASIKRPATRRAITAVMAVGSGTAIIGATILYNNNNNNNKSLDPNSQQSKSSSILSRLYSPLFNNPIHAEQQQQQQQEQTTAAIDAAMTSHSQGDGLLKRSATAAGGPPTDPAQNWIPPSRDEMLNMLKGNQKDGKPIPDDDVSARRDFDLLIVGGGATGVGCALDATTRGLRVALVERDDFASGTSSRSTKLVHGGVRYLEKAVMELDIEQYKLVVEALHERGIFLKIAPYLSYQLPIMLPIYQYWKIPYYWAGSKAYDILAGKEGLSHSYFLSKRRALEAFPMLKSDRCVGAMVYYDGAHNDSRMNVAIALTAIAHGAVVANHVEVVEILKRKRTTLIGKFGHGDQEIYGAVVRDTLTGDTWTVRAKGVINATGPFSDSLRKMDQGITTKEIVAPSAGVHIILPNYYSPRRMGLLDPNTSDGRVIFFLPWQGNTIAGTTDSPTSVTYDPIPSEKDIAWILKEVENYLDPAIKVRRGDVLAAWSGIRPLVRDPAAKNTAALVRNHMINVSESGLLTIAGGKWTTYRAMAQETIDRAIEVFDLRPTGPCATERTVLLGSHGWSQNMFIKLIQHFGIETEVAQHLSESYGDRAWAVAAMAALTGHRWPIFGRRIAAGYPYIEAEVRYAVRREYACTAVDVLARRTRLAMLNAQAAKEALPRVIEIMAEELHWTPDRQREEYENAIKFLGTMGLELPPTPIDGTVSTPTDDTTFYTRSHFVPEELARYKAEFSRMDADGDGRIGERDLGKVLKGLGVVMTPAEMERVIAEVDLNKNGVIEFGEFLEVLAAVKEIRQRSRFARIVAEMEERKQFSTVRSGGGV
ncbi:mitochondrial glycerol-3-phosphate dehydrogenase [Blyttiomyces sp. JEL0837]|nr:mitochondrial glycerol-3-phosphate dehydrogenase [Blyttiomyces sp. JEL0837]